MAVVKIVKPINPKEAARHKDEAEMFYREIEDDDLADKIANMSRHEFMRHPELWPW